MLQFKVGGGNILGMEHTLTMIYCLRHLTNNARRFGTTALLLQLIPVAQMFFLLTTATGSALWAAKLEQQRNLLEGQGTGHVPSHADGEPRSYTDNPA
jgi:hypothetical protein